MNNTTFLCTLSLIKDFLRSHDYSLALEALEKDSMSPMADPLLPSLPPLLQLVQGAIDQTSSLTPL